MATQYDTPVGVGGKIDTTTGKVLTGANAGQVAGQNDNAVGSTNSYSPIPVATLATPAPTPIKVTPVVPSTGSVGLSAQVGAMAAQNQDQYNADLAAKTGVAQQNKDTSFQDLLKNQLGIQGQTELTAGQYASTGVDAASKELKTINNQILADQVATRHQIETLKATNPMGLSTEAINSQIQDIQDKSTSRQADLAVTQLAKQGQYDSAKAIADRAVAVKMERQKTINDALKLTYDENKDLFTTAEKRQFETAQKDRERKLDMETYKEKAKYDQIIKQSDPLYQAQLGKAQFDLEALKNPTSIPGISKETADRMDKLPLTEKTTLVDAADTIDQLSRLKNLVTTTDIVTLQNPLTPEGILFNRLATDVADKMARKRTGAVVTASEQENFKKILGLSFFTRLNSDPATVNSEIDKFINVHNDTASLIDPRGDIRQALKNNTTANQESAYVDNVAKTLGGGTDSISAYLASFNPK